MPEYITEIGHAMLPYVITIVGAISSYIAFRVKIYVDQKIAANEEKVNTEVKKQVISDTVKYVQQVYEDLKGSEKLQKALETSKQWLNDKGITITEAEATILIESAIKGFKDGWKTEKSLEILPEPEGQVEQENVAE